jgi:hypothetical protein
MGLFVFMAIIGAFAAWDHQLSVNAKDCQEACAKW